MAGELRRAIGAVQGVAHAHGDGFPILDHAHHQFEVAADHLQEIVEIVRHAAGQVADGLHPLGPAKLILGILAFGDVAGGADDAVDLPLDVAHRNQDRLPNPDAAGQCYAVAGE